MAKTFKEYPLPSEIERFYEQATKTVASIAEAMPQSLDEQYVVLTLFVKDRMFLQYIIKNYPESASPLTNDTLPIKAVKHAATIFSPGNTPLERLAIIPFFLSGNVTIEESAMQLKRIYNVSGKCTLHVPTDGRIGVWMITEVEQ